MKKYVHSFSLLACLLATACNSATKVGENSQYLSAGSQNLVDTATANAPAKAEGLAAFLFDAIEYNFGKVPEGTKVKHTFKFKNIGKQPLIIAEVHPQCGCTSSEYTKRAVMPNETGEITLELDTSNKRGQTEKNARVVANVEGGTVFLFLKGEILDNEPPSAPYAKPH
jgi:predicted small secreted protein